MTDLPIAAAIQFSAWSGMTLKERLQELCSTFLRSHNATDPNLKPITADFAALRLSMSTSQTLNNDASATDSTIPKGRDIVQPEACGGSSERFWEPWPSTIAGCHHFHASVKVFH